MVIVMTWSSTVQWIGMASTVPAYADPMTETHHAEELDFAGASQALAELDQLDVPAMELMYKLECSGEDFYNLLADRIGNEEVATLLRRNAKEELGHARRIARAIAIKQGHEFEPGAELQERYAVALPDVIDSAMLPFIVAGEQAGDAGYQGWADNEPDPAVARLLRLNGREETLHGERVAQAIAILEAATAP
jgi:rubrerythrin